MRVAIYLRVSTTSQEYERQRHELENWCKSNGHIITKLYEEKASGACDDRVEFNKMRLLTKDEVDAVLVWEFSRLGRKLSTVINVVEEFTSKGISIMTLKEKFQSLDCDGKQTAMGTMMLSMLSAMAVIERDNIMERSKSGKIEKLQSGEIDYTDAPPFGYLYKNKRIIIHEDEAVVVREIYQEYLNGFSQNEIARLHKMHQSKVCRILSNPVYCGRPYSNLLKKTLQAPKIISVDNYTAVREKCSQKRFKRAKRGSNTHPLRGKIYCEVCNHVLTKKGEAWGCHCFRSSIQQKFIDKSLDMVLVEYSKMREFKRVEKLDIDVAELERQYSTTSKLMYAVVDKLRELHTKYELLQSAFGDDKLKREKNEIAKNEMKLKDYDLELWDIRKKLQDAKAKIQYTKDNSSDLVERVTLHIIDRAYKSLIYSLVDSSEYVVTIRMRKDEYTIDKTK